MSDITFTTLRKKDGEFAPFREFYAKLLLNKPLENDELEKLLQIAIVLLNSKRELVRFFGYRIILQYALSKNDYTALNDLALNLGYIPISKILEHATINSEFQCDFFKEFLGSYKNVFRFKTGIFLTEGQYALQKDLFEKKKDLNNVVIAPTSYGKSEAIIFTALEVSKSCIIVPTNALLAQTKKRFLNSGADLSKKTIIIHHEMYSPSQNNLIAILTQERLLSLLQENPNAHFDKVYVDEAHNLLEKDSRANLLASCLVLLNHRNKNTIFNFFTPFLNDAKNLETKFLKLNTTELRKNEYIKSEKIFLIDFRKSDEALLYLYDQFINDFFEIPDEKYRSDIEFINVQAAPKNIIYFNTPRDVESYCSQLVKSRPLITSDFVSKASDSIKDYIHKDYFLLNCLSRGIVYHHGSMPDNVKLYIEQLYIEEPQIKFIVTTSTLLEGVNIPADQIFVMSTSKGIRDLSPSQFKNLIGRVCRFGDIFSSGNPDNLQKLMPRVFLLGTEYSRASSNLREFLSKKLKVDRDQKDKVENVLLTHTEVVDEMTEKSLVELMESIDRASTGIDARRVATAFGKSCFKNRISEFDIFSYEKEGQKKVEALIYAKKKADDVLQIMELVFELFVNPIKTKHIDSGNDDLIKKEYKFFQLSVQGARNAYAMYLRWKSENISFNQMIAIVVQYWKQNNDDGLVYVGKWGDISKGRIGIWKNWINVKKKTEYELVNLAIVRIKDEQDYVDHFLFKFIEVLNDMDLIKTDLFLNLKYGTTDKNKIFFIKTGFSSSLASLLLNKYKEKLHFNVQENEIVINSTLVTLMKQNGENEILIHELKYHIKS